MFRSVAIAAAIAAQSIAASQAVPPVGCQVFVECDTAQLVRAVPELAGL